MKNNKNKILILLISFTLLVLNNIYSQNIDSVSFFDLPNGVEANQPVYDYFYDTVEFRSEVFFDADIDEIHLVVSRVYLNEVLVDSSFNVTVEDIGCRSIINPSNGDDCGSEDSTAGFRIGLEYGLNVIVLDAYKYTTSPPFTIVASTDTLFIEHPEPAVTSVIFSDTIPGIIPGIADTTRFFNDLVQFQAQISYNDSFSYQDAINLDVYFDNTLIEELSQTVQTDSTGGGQQSCLIPEDGLIDVQLPDYEAHYIHFCSYFEVWADSVVCSDSLLVQRIEPKINSHLYVDKDADFSPNDPVVLFNDSIHFRTQLEYNDNLNSGDSIKVVVWREVWDEQGGYSGFSRVDSAFGITSEVYQPITIPSDGNNRFNIDLDLDFNDSILVYFETWFIRDGQEFDHYSTKDISMLRIYHPASRVEAVGFDEWYPPQVSTANNATTEIFDTEFQFRAQIEYNDIYSHDQDTLCLDVFYQGTQVGQTHKIATDTTGMSPGGNNMATIPLAGDALIPILLDYGIGAVNFRAYFEGFGMEPDSIVNSDIIYINRLKPEINSMSYESLYPANLSTTDWNIIYTDSVMLRTKLWYNDSVNYYDSIRVIAWREVYSEGQAERVDTAYNITVERNPDELFILIPPENEERLMVPLEERYDSILIYFEANFIRDDLQVPDVFYSYNTDTLKIIHPVPAVREVLYDTIVSHSESIIVPNTSNNYFTVFDTAVKVRMQIAYDDTCSVDDELILQAYYNDIAYEPIFSDFTRVWGDGSISIPRDEEDLFNINLEYGDDVADWDTIYFKSYFSKSSDSIVSSDSLFIYRERPRIQSAIYTPVLPNYVNTQSYDTVFHDFIQFDVTLEYNDTLYLYDQIKTVVYREIIGGDIEPVGSLTLAKPASGNSIDFTGFQVDLDSYFDDSIRVFIKSWFIRPGLTDAEIYNEGGEYALLMYHPAPAVTSVKYNAWKPTIDTSGNTRSEFFDESLKFQSLIYYNDSFSNGEQINLQAYFDGLPFGNVFSNNTIESNFPQCLIPANDSILIDLPDYEEHSIHFCTYFDNEYPDPEKCSETLHVKRVKPEIESFEYLNPYPENLFDNGWQTVYTDSLKFRTKLWYNDSININDSVQLIAMREIYSEGQIESIDTAYNITIERESHPDSLYLMIPPENEDRLIIPLNERYDSILVYFQANFIRDLLDADTFYSYNTDTLKIIHPAPAVKELTYQTRIGMPSEEIITPGIPTTVFDTTIQVRMQINYDDTCSVEDGVFIKAYFNGQPDGQQLFDYTSVWGQGSIFMPRIDSSLFNFPLQYGDFENDYDYIHFESYFTKTPDSIVSSDSLIIYRAKPVITNHQYIPVTPDYLSTTEIKTIFHDTITFDLSLTYNDDVTEGDEIETKIFCRVNEAPEPIELETIIQPKPTSTNSVLIEGIQVALNPYWDDTIKVYFESRILRSDLPDTEIYNQDGQSAFLIYHPRPRVESVEFDVLDPNELYNYLNEEIEIYNKEVLFGAMVFYNDTFSSNETIRINTIHEYYQNEVLKRDTVDNEITTTPISPGLPVIVTFPDSTFAIGPSDSSYHKFYIDAWFDMEDFVQQGDTMPSDNLMVRYRINTAPEIEITTLYDTLCKNPDSVLIRGVVTDATGMVDSVWVDINGVISFVDSISDQDQNYEQSFYTYLDLNQSINSINAWAKDKVPFTEDEELGSEEDSIRVIYLHFKKDLQTEYYNDDTLIQLEALPVGGIFSGDGILYESGKFNPSDAGIGNHILEYEFATNNQNVAEISTNVRVIEKSSIRGKSMVCNNSLEPYFILPKDTTINSVHWALDEGVVQNYYAYLDSIEVKWCSSESYGIISTQINNTFNSYGMDRLVAIDVLDSPERGLIMKKDNVLFCSINDSSLMYEWFKNGQNYQDCSHSPYLYDNEMNSGDHYYVNVSGYNDCRCAQKSNLIIIPDTISNGYISNDSILQVSLLAGQEIIQSIDGYSAMDIEPIDIVQYKKFKIILKEELTDKIVVNLTMQTLKLPTNYKLRVFNLGKLNYRIKLIQE